MVIVGDASAPAGTSVVGWESLTRYMRFKGVGNAKVD